MALSYFDNKTQTPSEEDIAKALGSSYELWSELKEFVLKNHPIANEEWSYSGKSLGWGLRIKDKKRVVIYLIPAEGCFKIGLVYGVKAYTEALESKISKTVKDIINAAPVYGEGRGFRIEVNKRKTLSDIKVLVEIKLKN